MIRIALILAAIASPAAAQDDGCTDRAGILGRLADQFGEHRVAAWFDDTARQIVELYANPKTGTMTLLRTRPDGKTCFDGAGQMFQTFAPEPEGDPT